MIFPFSVAAFVAGRIFLSLSLSEWPYGSFREKGLSPRRAPGLLTVAVRQSSVNDMIRSLEERRETIGPDSIPGLRLHPITSVGVRRGE